MRRREATTASRANTRRAAEEASRRPYRAGVSADAYHTLRSDDKQKRSVPAISLSLTRSKRQAGSSDRRRRHVTDERTPAHDQQRQPPLKIRRQYEWNIARTRTQRAHPSDESSSSAARRRRSRSWRRRSARSCSDSRRDDFLAMTASFRFGPARRGPVPTSTHPRTGAKLGGQARGGRVDRVARRRPQAASARAKPTHRARRDCFLDRCFQPRRGSQSQRGPGFSPTSEAAATPAHDKTSAFPKCASRTTVSRSRCLSSAARASGSCAASPSEAGAADGTADAVGARPERA